MSSKEIENLKTALSYARERISCLERDHNEDGDIPVRILAILADIRIKSGVGCKPMLSELADAIAERVQFD